MPDAPQRIATDTSNQKLPIRFGETLKPIRPVAWIWAS